MQSKGSDRKQNTSTATCFLRCYAVLTGKELPSM